jgi:uncharacterized membrane protein
MTHARISQLERELTDIKSENEIIRVDVARLRRELVEKMPEYFSFKDIFRAFFGSLFFGFSLLFSGNLVRVAGIMGLYDLLLVVLFTILTITIEIYFIGYSRVINKTRRAFGQFWFKRVVAFYAVATFVSLLLSYIFGLHMITDLYTYRNLVIILSAPCAIGASISDLLKKY